MILNHISVRGPDALTPSIDTLMGAGLVSFDRVDVSCHLTAFRISESLAKKNTPVTFQRHCFLLL